jgi:hypothetical protein
MKDMTLLKNLTQDPVQKEAFRIASQVVYFRDNEKFYEEEDHDVNLEAEKSEYQNLLNLLKNPKENGNLISFLKSLDGQITK